MTIASPDRAPGEAINLRSDLVSPPLQRRPRAEGVVGVPARTVLDRYRRRAIIGDGVAALAAAMAAYLIRYGATTYLEYLAVTLLVPLAWLATVAIQRGYERRFLGAGPEEYRKIFDGGLLLFTAIAVGSYALHGEFARGYLVIFIPVTVVGSVAFRHALRTWLFRLRARGVALHRVLVVGRADAVVAVIEKLNREPQHGLAAVGVCVPAVGVRVSHVHGVPVLGDPGGILDAVDEVGADVVAVVSHPDLSGHALRRLAWSLEERQVDLVVSPGIVEVAGPRLSIRPVAGMSLLHLERPAVSGGKMLAKGAFDRLAGACLLVMFAPLLAVGALAVRATSHGPALFRQVRVGVDGAHFTMLKFRTMVIDAEARRADLTSLDEGNGMLFKIRDDPRVTKVGAVLRRFSLDELPQLINVVRGEMSLVGPRPPLPAEVGEYTDDAVRRLRVRPGMTGLWQVSGRSDLSWEESLRLDLRYVDNWSLALDLSILWRTCHAVVRGSGAY